MSDEEPPPWWAPQQPDPAVPQAARPDPALPPAAPVQGPPTFEPSPYDSVYGSAYAPTPGTPDTVGRTDQRGPGWLVLLLAGLVIALVAGLIGGFIGAWLDSDGRASGRGPVSLGTTPSGSLSRSPESVAGIAQR